MQALRKNHFKIISVNLAKKIIIVLMVILFFDFFLFATPAMANEIDHYAIENGDIILVDENIYSSEVGLAEENEPIFINNLPENKDLGVINVKYRLITAYNSEPGQTDDSPCITANGFNVCEHGQEDTVAANFLPFGAKIKLPELFGDRVFIVRDRMNARFSNRIDIWMVEKQDAKKFGVKLAKVEILE